MQGEFLQTMFFVGFMTGNGLLGRLADDWGRHKVMSGAAVGLIITTLISAVAPNFLFYSIFRVMSGSMAAGHCLAGYVLVSHIYDVYIGTYMHVIRIMNYSLTQDSCCDMNQNPRLL